MTREQKMQAVVEAARKITRWPDGVVDGGAIVDRDAVAALWRTLDSLDAHTEAQEVVTLAVWDNMHGAHFWRWPARLLTIVRKRFKPTCHGAASAPSRCRSRGRAGDECGP